MPNGENLEMMGTRGAEALHKIACNNEENIKREEIVHEDTDLVSGEEQKNSKNKKKINRHAFLEKHPVAYVLVHMAWSFIFIEVISVLVMGNFFATIGLNEYLSTVAGGLIYLACHAINYKPEYKGNIKGGNTALGFRLASFMCIYWIYILIQLFVWGEYTNPTVTTVSLALMAGVCEEVIFRLVPVSCLMRQWRDEKRIPAVLAISAISFGLMHAGNMTMGAGVAITIVQVLGTGLMGVLFGAVYLRSGNILIPILMHSITDFICFLDASQVNTEGIMTAASLSVINYIDILITLILAIIGIYLVRPSKRAEIIAMWDNKFSRNEITNS